MSEDIRAAVAVLEKRAVSLANESRKCLAEASRLRRSYLTDLMATLEDASAEVATWPDWLREEHEAIARYDDKTRDYNDY